MEVENVTQPDLERHKRAAELSAMDARGLSWTAWERMRLQPSEEGDALEWVELRASLGMRFGRESNWAAVGERQAGSNAFLQALERWMRGQKMSAMLLLQRFLKRYPEHCLAQLHLGLFYMEAGQASEAVATLRSLAEDRDHFAPAAFCLARIRMSGARWTEALTLLHALPPEVAAPGEREWLLGDCYRALDARDEASRFFAQAAAYSCPIPTFWNRYALFLGEVAGGEEQAITVLETGDQVTGGRLEFALTAARTSRQWVVIRCDISEKWLDAALKRGGEERSIKAESIYNGCRLFRNGKDPTALDNALRAAFDLHARYPDYSEAAFALGNVLFYYNRIREGLNYLRSGFCPGKRDWVQKSVYLFHSNYDETLSVEELAERHRDLGRAFEDAMPLLPPAEVSLDACKPLRVGFVSPDFRNHPVGYFLDAICENFDESRIEPYFYASKIEKSEVAQRFRDRSGWRDITTLSDRAAADCIRADGIHILVDLAGFTADHRLPLFALRPAPVQASWLGYPGSTGLTRIDYRISDAMVDPPGAADRLSTETIFRLSNGFHAFRPPFPYPRVMPLPALREKVVTFGCFNNLHKVNARVIALWAALLNAVPNSRLLLKHDNLALPQNRNWIRDSFRMLDIDDSRIHLKGRTDTLAKHVGSYNWLDIALDPFPYNGTTTTCEALYMGVPVICLEGDRHAARVSASFMRRLGLDDWVAGDEAEYVQIAQEKAADLEALAALRASLRQRFCESPLGRPAALAVDLDHAFHAMWHQHEHAAGPVPSPSTPNAIQPQSIK